MFCCFCAVTLTITVASNNEALIPLSEENYKKVTLLLILALLLKVRIIEMCFKVMLNYCIYYFAQILHCKCTVHYLCFDRQMTCPRCITDYHLVTDEHHLAISSS